MTKISIVLAVLISFVISAAAGPVIIPILRKLKVGQTVRDDGPQTHLKKNGTPTMGGIIFLLAVLITSLIYAPHYPKVIPILFMTVGFGIVGFLDDFIKVVLHRSEGLTPAPEDGRTAGCDGGICLLYGKYFRCGSCDAGTVLPGDQY